MANQSKYLAFSFWTKSVNEKEIFIVVVPINEKQSQEKKQGTCCTNRSNFSDTFFFKEESINFSPILSSVHTDYSLDFIVLELLHKYTYYINIL